MKSSSPLVRDVERSDRSGQFSGGGGGVHCSLRVLVRDQRVMTLTSSCKMMSFTLPLPQMRVSVLHSPVD